MDKLLYSIAEVAEMTGWAEMTLIRDCRAGRIDHVHRGNAYGMTLAQINKAIAEHTKQKANSSARTAADREQQEMEATRLLALRNTRGRGAA